MRARPAPLIMTEHPPYQILPHEQRARLFGVDYAVQMLPNGGELYLTQQAWHWQDYLQPERWWDAENLSVHGVRQGGSTGTVYRARSTPPGQPPRDFVVKYSRLAQDVPLFIPDEFLDSLPREAVAKARFLGPFAEFGLIHELRHTVLNQGYRRLRTKIPLAIYSPPEKYPLWQTGRHTDIFRGHLRTVGQEQFENGLHQVTLDIQRDYLEIFAWVHGLDAEEAFNRGLLSQQELVALSRHSNRTLARLGYRVLDNKPRHLIVRMTPDGQLLRHRGEYVYAMIDFELLQRHEDAPSERFRQKVTLD
jgi:hypothetical protein